MSAEDRKELTRLINEWNSSRLELFALSQPNERLEFHGVMRFYFQDTGEKVSTKCIRVDSTATTEDVVKVLIEKFRPDMKSLSLPTDYSIYEVHADSQERKLDRNERPLWIQLDWGKEGREGRFLLKNENVKTFHVDPNESGLLRDKKRLSKREKKKLHQQEREINSEKTEEKDEKGKVAEQLYKEVPDSNFTRSISNPEIVMARRRQQKLENKLKQIKTIEGGGTLKVYGETLKPDVPYKTLLLSNNDNAAFVVKETLDKYGLGSEDTDNYCLVQVVTPSREDRDKYGAQIKEYILEDNALPLAILINHPPTTGSIIFQIRRCPPDIIALRKKKRQEQSALDLQKQGMSDKMASSQSNLPNQQQHQNSTVPHQESTKLPFLVELTQEGFNPRIILIKSDFYEVGNDKLIASTHPTNYIRIDSNIPNIEKKHCAIKKSIDNFQVLVIPYAETYVNDRLIDEPTQLFNGFTLRLGKYCLFRLENPNETGLIIGLNNQMNKQNEQVHHQSNPAVANYGLLYDSGESTEIKAHQPQQLYSQSLSNIQPRSGVKSQVNVPAVVKTAPTPVLSSGGGESGLPGLLEFSDDSEDVLLQQICSQRVWEGFRLAPVYTMYMMLRFRLSQKYKPECSFGEKLHSIGVIIHKMVNYIRAAVDQAHADKHLLPYWLANSSELLYFFKHDVHLNQQSVDAQEALAECVQVAFKYLVSLVQKQIDRVLVAFFDPSDLVDDVEYDAPISNTMNNRATLKSVLQSLNETMYLMRSSRVNAALTIQIFSQLFHYISTWLFNRLVSKDQRSGLCSRYWGEKLIGRLSKLQTWAEKQGLELAADCHLQRIIQAAYLLHAPKHDIRQLSGISSNCFALNSAQIKCLLKNYVLGPQEPPLSAQLCNNLFAIAQNTADDVIRQEGRIVRVEEEIDLQLPFMLPEDGHSSEMIKGLGKGFLDFLEILQNSGHCWLWQNTQGPGNWRKFFNKEPQPQVVVANTESKSSQSNLHVNHQPIDAHNSPSTSLIAPGNVGPKVIQLKLGKKNNSLGLSIVAARGNNNVTGIYVKSVVPGGAASDDGRISAGDQLLAVDDHSLVSVTQERAAELMCKSGPLVMLTVAKEAASYHDLNDILLGKSTAPLQTLQTPPPPTQFLNNQQLEYEQIWAKQPELNVVQNRAIGIGPRAYQQQLPPQQQQQLPQQLKQSENQLQELRNYENQMVNNNTATLNNRAAVTTKPALPPNKPSSSSQLRFNHHEEAMTMLKKRIDVVNELEAKSYRSNDEENKLNKLRTEIEFDKRVIEIEGDENDRANAIPNEYFFQHRSLQLETSASENKQSRQVEEKSRVDSGAFVESEHLGIMKQPQQQPTSSSSSSSDQLDSTPNTPPSIPQAQPKRVMFSDTSNLLEFEQDNFEPADDNTPSVIGANEIYVDHRLKIKQQQQQQMAQLVIEGEKLSFKDKMRLFARQSGAENTNGDSENRPKASRKQREIESKIESK